MFAKRFWEAPVICGVWEDSVFDLMSQKRRLLFIQSQQSLHTV
jgi:hypothetical protein